MLKITIFAIVIGLTQGMSELFPISSFGHSIIVNNILSYFLHGIPTLESNSFISFILVTHIGTLTVLIFEYRHIMLHILKNLNKNKNIKRWIVLVLPVCIVGLLLEPIIKDTFNSIKSVSIILLINGIILLLSDINYRSKRNRSYKEIDITLLLDTLPIRESFKFGLVQSLAIIPGISRSGIIMAYGLYKRYKYSIIPTFSFLLGIPVIFIATITHLNYVIDTSVDLYMNIIGYITSLISSYFSIKFFSNYNNKITLYTFGLYCIVISIIILII